MGSTMSKSPHAQRIEAQSVVNRPRRRTLKRMKSSLYFETPTLPEDKFKNIPQSVCDDDDDDDDDELRNDNTDDGDIPPSVDFIDRGIAPSADVIDEKITSSSAVVIEQQPRSTNTDIQFTLDGGGSGVSEAEASGFPFENIVFEGGGSQGSAYYGAIMELEKLGLLHTFKRYAGTSIGSTVAALVALGYGGEFFDNLMRNGPYATDFLDAKCGVCSFIPNFWRYFGWHPGKLWFDWVGVNVEKKLGDKNATFRDLYEATGRELCIVVTNLSLMVEEYCHVKTTPDLPIRMAMRMSIAVPAFMCAIKHRHMDRTDVYVDGGLICNYPIHCYDGWWLSMKQEDSFLKRIRPLKDYTKLMTKKERFGIRNDKTMGLIIISDFDSHVLAVNPDLQEETAPIPDTKLARAQLQKNKHKKRANRLHGLVTDAMSRFLETLNRANADGNDTISREEFKLAFTKRGVTEKDITLLFGDVEESNLDSIFDSLDTDGNGEVDFNELMALAERRGIGLQTHHLGLGWKEVRTTGDFITGCFQTLLLNVKRAFTEGDDIERTAIINTIYIKSMDFKLEQEDINFLVEQGRRGVRAFLSQWKNKHDKTDYHEEQTKL